MIHARRPDSRTCHVEDVREYNICTEDMMEHPLAFPTVQVVSCYIIDHRTFHAGLSDETYARRSEDSRKLLALSDAAPRAQMQARTPGTVA